MPTDGCAACREENEAVGAGEHDFGKFLRNFISDIDRLTEENA